MKLPLQQLKSGRWIFEIYVVAATIMLFLFAFLYLGLPVTVVDVLAFAAVGFAFIFFKKLVALLFNVHVSGNIWIAGIIFSVVATLIASSFGMPIIIPLFNFNKYSRRKTLTGLKRGEINAHEKWKVAVFSTLALSFIAMLTLLAWGRYGGITFFAAGIAIAMFVLVDFLPFEKFDGTTLIYHNNLVYYITFMLLILFTATGLISYSWVLPVFIALLVFNIATYIMNLW